MMRSCVAETRLKEILETADHKDMVPTVLRQSPEFGDLNNFDVFRILSSDPHCDGSYCDSPPPAHHPLVYPRYGSMGGHPFYVPMFSYHSGRSNSISSQYSSQSSQASDASGNSQGAIDNRIEQAMDLVKSHLMNAVRSEVEELKEKIVGLEIKIDHLQNENDILKTHAPTDVVNQLPQLAPTPPQAMMMGPPPMSGLNLAAPQPVMMSAPANGMHGPAQGPPSQGGAPTNGHTHPQTNGGTTQN